MTKNTAYYLAKRYAARYKTATTVAARRKALCQYEELVDLLGYDPLI